MKANFYPNYFFWPLAILFAVDTLGAIPMDLPASGFDQEAGFTARSYSPSVDSAELKFDVVIYGGTAAGILCAVQLAKSGKRVAIVEPSGYLGGMTTEGLGGSDINNHKDFKNDAAIGGLTLDFYHAVAKHYGISNFEEVKNHTNTWRFEPHVADSILSAWIQQYQIPVYLNERLRLHPSAVQKAFNTISAFETLSGKTFQAQFFVDATYEGDLIHFAGISTVVGRESNAQYKERKNGIRATNTYRNFKVAIDPYLIPGDPSSGVIHSVQKEYWNPLDSGQADRRIQAFCFRACLTKDAANRVPFIKPENYNREWYEIYLRYEKAGGQLYGPYYSIPNQKTDLGAWHDLSHNLYGMNHAYPDGDYHIREDIYQYHLDFTKGLFWFLSNDPEVSEPTRKKWSEWGTTKDEFKDNQGWPRKIYIRDGRRMVSDYVITEHHTRRDTFITVADPVGVAYWPPDVHHVRRIIKDDLVYNEGFVFGGKDWKPFAISYQSLIPKEEECANLLTPTCLSSSHIAYGAIRLEWTFMVLGQSIGCALNLCLDNEKSIHQLEYHELEKQLLQEGQVLTAPSVE